MGGLKSLLEKNVKKIQDRMKKQGMILLGPLVCSYWFFLRI
jgi:hypothetical protein